MEHILARLASDSRPVARRLVRLVFNSFLPVNQPEEVWCERCVALLQMNRAAARRFYQLAPELTACANVGTAAGPRARPGPPPSRSGASRGPRRGAAGVRRVVLLLLLGRFAEDAGKLIVDCPTRFSKADSRDSPLFERLHPEGHQGVPGGRRGAREGERECKWPRRPDAARADLPLAGGEGSASGPRCHFHSRFRWAARARGSPGAGVGESRATQQAFVSGAP